MPHHLRKKYEARLQRAFTDGFERQLLEAAFDNLDSPGALRFNNFAYALRELLRHLLHRLSPDEEVMACRWFKADKVTKGGITRAHRATYAIQGGLSDDFVTKKLRINVSKVRSDLLDTIGVLNKYTHIEISTFGLINSETRQLATECLDATQYFIEHIEECRAQVAGELAGHLDHHLLHHVLSETIDSVDELATHHFVEDVNVDEVEITRIGPSKIKLVVYGNVECELQYGSSSDIRNDIGMVMSESFPLKAELTVQMVRPLGKTAVVDQFSVDTSDWYD